MMVELVNTLLLLNVVVLLSYCSVTDIRYGKIPNQAILMSLLMTVVLDFAMLIVGNGSWEKYFLNSLLVAVFAILFYHFKFWRAGDAKLIIATFVAISPINYPSIENKSMATVGVFYYICIFFVAYLYLIFESFFLFATDRKRVKRSNLSVNYFGKIILRCFNTWVALSIFSLFIRTVTLPFFYLDRLLLGFINFFIAILIQKIKAIEKLSTLVVMLSIYILGHRFISLKLLNLKYLIFIFMLILLRYLLSMFNYEEIKASDLSEGMILSVDTVLNFKGSKIKNLPKFTTEDMDSILTAEEVSAVKKWAEKKLTSTKKMNKKYCASKEVIEGEISGMLEDDIENNIEEIKIIIVRKLPFGIFIAVGTAIFIISGVIL